MRAAAEPADGRLRFTFDNPQLARAGGEAGQATLTATELAPMFPQAFEPTFVVGRGGNFVGVEGTDDFRSTLAMLVLSGIAGADKQESMRRFVPGLLGREASDERLQQFAVMRWTGQVEFWNGRSLAQGTVTRWTEKRTAPMAGNPILPYQNELEFVRRTRCSDKDDGQRCVELRLTAVVAEKDLKDFADAIWRLRQDPAHNETRFGADELRIEFSLVTDPKTLLPYRYHQSTRQAMRMIEQSVTQEFRTQDDLDLIYAY